MADPERLAAPRERSEILIFNAFSHAPRGENGFCLPNEIRCHSLRECARVHTRPWWHSRSPEWVVLTQRSAVQWIDVESCLQQMDTGLERRHVALMRCLHERVVQECLGRRQHHRSTGIHGK